MVASKSKHFAHSAVVAALCAACGGESLSLDTPSAVLPSADPGVVAELREYPDFLVSHGDRVYWSGASHMVERYWVRSCRKNDCARSVITYAQSSLAPRWVSVTDDELYFLLGRPAVSVVACPIEGCLEPRVVVNQADAFALDGDTVVYASRAQVPPGIYRTPRSGGASERLIETDASINRLLVAGEQVFWTTDGGEVQRAAMNGLTPVETLSRYELTRVSLAKSDDAVYWSTHLLAASIERCPLSGCPGGPELVTNSVRIPGSLLSVGKSLYLQVELDTSDVGLLACTLPDCRNRQLVTGEVSRGTSAIAVDDEFIYAFSHQGYRFRFQSLPTDGVNDPSGIPLASLRRYPRR